MDRNEFDLLVRDAEFVLRTHVMPFRHRPTRTPVDVVIAGSGLEREFQRRAIATDVAGVTIPVITPEDLIVAKILAGRPKDIEDVRHIIHQHRPALDVERIREILGQLEEALTLADLIPVFEREWTRS